MRKDAQKKHDSTEQQVADKVKKNPGQIKETGGPRGPEPTRYGDWEHKGRCIDF